MNELLIVTLAQILAIVSPGPDFIVVTQQSLVNSRRAGIYSALGVGLGILVHAAYTLAGLGLVISKSIVLYTGIKYLGALYLIYLGYQSIRYSSRAKDVALIQVSEVALAGSNAFKIGFLSNVLNPKVSLFFLALFSQIVDLSTPLMIKVFYGLEMAAITTVWFISVALVFSNTGIKLRIQKIQKYVQQALGAVLIALGLKIALSK